MTPGELKAWEILKGLDPRDVEKNTLSVFDPADNSYKLKSLNREFSLRVNDRAVTPLTTDAASMHNRVRYFLDLAAIWYMAEAKDIGTTGRLIKPNSMKGGEQFYKGTHVLPLDAVAKKYGNDKDGFLLKAKDLGGTPKDGHGDAAAVLYPMPRVPMTIVLWISDDEFPARADLFFDSSAELQAALDINWSMAMMTLIMIL